MVSHSIHLLEWGMNKSVARGVHAGMEKGGVIHVRGNEYEEEKKSDEYHDQELSLDVAGEVTQE
jgi:hypothetical protein